MRRSAGIAGCCLALALATCSAPPALAGPRFSVGLSAWLSEGETVHSHDASFLDNWLGNPTSVLTYGSLDSTVLELAGEVGLSRRFTLGGRLGRGGIGGGQLIDDDYVSAAGAAGFGATVSGAHRWSRTHSDVGSDELTSFELGLGFAVLRPDDGRSLEAFGGYGELDESYLATGLRQIECTLPFGDPLGCAPAGSAGFEGQPVITNDLEWQTWRLGLRGWVLAGRRVRLGGSLAWMPGAEVRSDDVHLLREDLAQDPSIAIDGSGDGYELRAEVGVRLSRRFTLEAGWRRRTLEADGGSVVFYPADEAAIPTRLGTMESERDGFTLGVGFETARPASPPAP